jgi:predicted ribosomally synthesized peptide with nif11-like leader
MSVENLKKYGKLCAEDEKVRARAKEIGLQDIDGQVAYGKSLGLDFTREDFKVLANETGIERKEELDEEELKKVAGGAVTATMAVAMVALGLCSAAGFAAAANKPGW